MSPKQHFVLATHYNQSCTYCYCYYTCCYLAGHSAGGAVDGASGSRLTFKYSTFTNSHATAPVSTGGAVYTEGLLVCTDAVFTNTSGTQQSLLQSCCLSVCYKSCQADDVSTCASASTTLHNILLPLCTQLVHTVVQSQLQWIPVSFWIGHT
jgi:hypothetical protein